MHKLDGHLRVATLDDIQPGHIFRMGSQVPDESGGHWVTPSFQDCIVVRKWHPGGDPAKGDRGVGPLLVELARPYLYVHLTGTTSPGVLAGCENFTVHADRLCGGTSLFRLVTMSTGKPAIMNLDR